MAPAAAADSIKPRDVCVVGVARTPMGGFLGTLSSLPATKLGSVAIESALKRANVDPSLVQEVFFGNVLSANLGQAPARQAALGARIHNTVICTTVNKACASWMKATMLVAQSIQLGINDVVVAGGMESMSNVPKYLAEVRKGSRLGHDFVVDGMLKDGLWDVYTFGGIEAEEWKRWSWWCLQWWRRCIRACCRTCVIFLWCLFQNLIMEERNRNNYGFLDLRQIMDGTGRNCSMEKKVGPPLKMSTWAKALKTTGSLSVDGFMSGRGFKTLGLLAGPNFQWRKGVECAKGLLS